MSNVIIERVVAGVLNTNTYVVAKDGRGFIVDSNGKASKIDEVVERLGVTVEAVLLTHGHFDHCMLAKHYQEKGVKVYIGSEDNEKLSTHKNLALMCGLAFPYMSADVMVTDGDVLDIAGMQIKVLSTPGHSVGSVTYVLDEANAIFVGDLLLKLSYGRTDFYDGDFDTLVNSVKKIFTLEKNYTIYTGHGDITELDYERRNNIINLEAGDKL